MVDPEPVAVLRQTVGRYLDETVGRYEVDSTGDFVVRHGSAVTHIRPELWEGRTIVRISSVTNTGLRVDGELTRFLAVESGKFVFGGFSLDESGREVVISHTLLGDFLSKKELEESLGAIVGTADMYDDLIEARFGGGTSPGPGPVFAPTPLPDSPRRRLRAGFGLLGFLAGIGAAIVAYQWIADSWALAIYAYLLASYLVARVACDLITDPYKVRRALYFLLQPAIATAIVYGAHELWDRWWLAALLGIVVGGIIAGAIAPLLFPRIHREETADTMERVGEAFR